MYIIYLSTSLLLNTVYVRIHHQTCFTIYTDSVYVFITKLALQYRVTAYDHIWAAFCTCSLKFLIRLIAFFVSISDQSHYHYHALLWHHCSVLSMPRPRPRTSYYGLLVQEVHILGWSLQPHQSLLAPPIPTSKKKNFNPQWRNSGPISLQ